MWGGRSKQKTKTKNPQTNKNKNPNKKQAFQHGQQSGLSNNKVTGTPSETHLKERNTVKSECCAWGTGMKGKRRRRGCGRGSGSLTVQDLNNTGW